MAKKKDDQPVIPEPLEDIQASPRDKPGIPINNPAHTGQFIVRHLGIPGRFAVIVYLYESKFLHIISKVLLPGPPKRARKSRDRRNSDVQPFQDARGAQIPGVFLHILAGLRGQFMAAVWVGA